VRVIQTSYFTACILCIPLLVWFWGTIGNAGIGVDIRLLIKPLLSTLYCLQFSVILVSIPFYLHNNSAGDVFFAVFTLILVPLPFVIIAWLAAATSIFAIIKIIVLQLLGAIIMRAVTQMIKGRLGLLKFEVILAIMASIFIWKTLNQW